MEKSDDYVDLLSQLEENKFNRLFRYLIDEVKNPEDIATTGSLTRDSVPLDLPDVELHLKVVGNLGSLMDNFITSWLFQIVHLPPFLWQGDFASKFLHERFRRACENLKARPDILKRVIDLPPSSPFHPIPEGYDYYIYTNIHQGIDEELFSDLAHNIFEEVLELPRNRHPVFGIGTPETSVKYAKHEIRNFIVDLLRMPSSYYLVAREGTISVMPMTEHGAYFASHLSVQNTSKTTGLSTIISSSLLENRHQLIGLSEFEFLLNSNKSKEADFQLFLERNPHFLFALDERYCEIRPHVCLFDAKKERLIPDFMARIQDTDIWDVIELKRPQHILTVGKCPAEKPSAAAAKGIAELLQYRDFFSIRNNRDAIAKKFGTSPYEPCLVLVIGRGRPRERYEWRTLRAGLPSVKVVSYDYLFQRARDCKLALA